VLVALKSDPTRTFALAVCWPGNGYWSFGGAGWLSEFAAASCLRPLSVPPGAYPADFLTAEVPSEVVAQGRCVVLQLLALDGAGVPVETVDVEVYGPGE